MEKSIVSAILKINGYSLTDWCYKKGIQPTQLYSAIRGNPTKGRLLDIRKMLAKEAKTAEPKVLEAIKQLKKA